MKKVIVKRQKGVYIAMMDGRPDIKGISENVSAAVGAMILANRDYFSLVIENR